MLSSLIGFYIAATLEPILPLLTNAKEFEILKEATVNVHKLDLSNLLSVSPIPVKKDEFVSPIIGARSSIIMDVKTGEILFEKNSSERRQTASITKLMTAIIILEENDPEEVVTISKTASTADGSQMMLHENEKITVENLLYGLLIQSANDAAESLAEYNSGSIEKFVEKMNKKALELGLINTHFQNPVGFDNKDNYSSALDLAKLARYVYQKDFVKETAIIKEKSVFAVDKEYKHDLKSTNELLDSYLKVKGLKTGKTDGAGLCNVSIAENDDGNDIITVVLNSPDRFKESKILIDWAFRAYIW